MSDYVYSAALELRTTNLKQVARDIQSTISGVNGQINVGVSRGTQTNVKNINRGLQTTARTMKSVTKASNETIDSIESFGKASALAIRRFAAFTVVTTGFISLSRNIKSSLHDAIEFQREVVKISQVTGRTVRGLQGLTGEITRLSTTLGVSSNELLTASRTLSQTGLAAKDVQKALQAIARSDLSPTFDNMVDTTEGVIAIMRQFGVVTDELEAKLSSINSVSKSFAIESSDIITAVRRAGGAFAAAGGKFEEFNALLTSVRSTTRESAESIATGFRTIFTRLQRTRTQNFLKDLGIDLRDAEGQFVGPYQAIERLSTALNQLRGTDPRFAQIIEELGGFRQVTKVIPLIKQYGVAQKALVVAQTQQNSLTRDAETAQQALAVQIAKVREEFEALIRTIADSDAFKAVTDSLIIITKSAIQLANALTPLLPALTALAGFGAIRFGGKFFNSPTGFFATLANPTKKKTGGIIPGVGNSDTVPAMLTPGEFVLSKKAVAQIGKNNLIDFNNAARFNTGGLVGSTLLGSTSKKAFVGAAGLQIGSNLLGLEGETKKAIDALTALTAQFGLMNAALNSNNNTIKQEEQIRKLSIKSQSRGSIVRRLKNESFGEFDNLTGISATKKGLTGKLVLSSDEVREVAALTKQEAESRERISRINRVLLKADDSRLRANKELLKTQKAQRRAAIAGNVGIGLAAVGGVAGNFLTNKANEQIQAGSDSTLLAGAGGALSLAATGASFGALVGPIGIAVGGVAGALYGLVTSIDDASNRIKEVKLAESVSNINDILLKVNQGQNPANRAFEITNRIRDIRNQQILAAGNPETAQNIQSDINTFLPELKVFIDNVARGSKTLKDFDKVAGDSLKFLALQQGLPFDELRKAYEDQIKNQNESLKVNKELEQEKSREAQRIREVNSIMQALAKSTKDLQEYQANFALQNSLVGGSTFSGNFFNTVSQASDLSLVSDINNFKASVTDFGKLFGESGKRLSNEIVAGAETASALPNILDKLKRDTETGFSKEGELISNLDRELRKIGTATFARERIIGGARGIIGSEGKDATLIAAVKEDANDVAKKLLGSLNEIGKVFAEAGSELTERKNIFVKGLADIQAAIDTRNQFRFKAIELRQERLKLAAGPNGLSLQDKLLEFDRKLGVITEGGPKTVQGIENRLNGPLGARSRLQAARFELQNLRAIGAQPADIQKAKNDFDKANSEVIRLTNSLKLLADTTIKVSAIQEEIAKEEAQKGANKSLLQTLAFGSAEEKVKLAQQTAAFTQLAQLSKAGKLDDVDKNLLAQLGQTAAPFFQQFQNQTFAGFKVKDLEEQVIKQIVGPNLAKQIEPSQKELDLKTQLDKALEEREKAAIVLAKQTQMSINDMINRMDGLFTTFISNLEKTFLKNEKSKAETDIKGAQSQIGAINNQVAKSTLIQSKTGLNKQQQLLLQKNQGQFDRLNELDKRIAGFSSAKVDKNIFRGFTLVPGIRPQDSPSGVGRLSQGITNENQIATAREAVVKDLQKSGFSQSEVNKFNKEFYSEIANEIPNGGVTQEEAVKITSQIVNSIITEGLQKSREERTNLTNSLIDNAGIPTTDIKKFQQAQATQGKSIEGINPDLLNTSKEEVQRLIKKRDEARQRAEDLQNQINSLPVPNRVSPTTPNTPPTTGQGFEQQFQNFDRGLNNIGDVYNQGIDRFENATEKWQQVAEALPTSLELAGALTVEVIVNGAEVLNKLGPSLEGLIIERINSAIENINNANKSGFPAPPIPYDPSKLV